MDYELIVNNETPKTIDGLIRMNAENYPEFYNLVHNVFVHLGPQKFDIEYPTRCSYRNNNPDVLDIKAVTIDFGCGSRKAITFKNNLEDGVEEYNEENFRIEKLYSYNDLELKSYGKKVDISNGLLFSTGQSLFIIMRDNEPPHLSRYTNCMLGTKQLSDVYILNVH